jgi:hypothetical protein
MRNVKLSLNRELIMLLFSIDTWRSGKIERYHLWRSARNVQVGVVNADIADPRRKKFHLKST